MSTDHLKLVPEPNAPPTDPLIGRVLDGRYEIERVLGEGGMGLVYKARHVTLGKPLAIKVLKAEVSKDQEIVQRFRQEAQSATAIGNHHIIDISDFGALPDGSTYFVMEFLDGISLTKAIEPNKPLKSTRTIHIAKQLCRALGAAHDVGIVHRDLKPDNIYLISRGGDKDFVKVLDFGIAKVGGQKSKLTQVGQVFGTPHYMSPEQCAGTQVDKRTDIYALGVIMYEMTSSRVPFDADNLMGILTKHLYEEPVQPHELPPPVDVPPALEAVIMKCLAKKPDLRYQTMQEVLADLELVEQGLTPGAVVEGVRRATQNNARGEARTDARIAARTDRGARGTTGNLTLDGTQFELPRSKPTGLIIGGVLGALVLVGGIVFAISGGDEPKAVVTPEPAANPAPATGAEQPASAKTEPSAPVLPEPPAIPTPPPHSETAHADQTAAAETTVRVHISSSPEGAEVVGDGALLGRTPFEVDRPKRGEPALELTLKFGGHKDSPVRITSNTQEKLDITLEKKRAAGTASAPRVTPAPVSRPPEPVRQEEPHRPRARPSTEVLDPWN
ncbi:MAG: Serine/threonine protein kinase PrkC, regulator of stationary phase [Myxococcaceae bacterium]|nr:Serine/threonine protein kinase PrkC, regulator of stationary phase [Myxococcaceae bacterium]